MTVNGGGEFRTAIYNPIGAFNAADTTFLSSLYFREGPAGARQAFGFGPTDPPLTVNAANTQATGTFTVNTLTFDLVQIVNPLFDANSVQNGSVLTQRYTVTNIGSTQVNFELVRYLDADMFFDGSFVDGGGRLITPSGTEVVFETDAGGGGATSTTFLGITGTGGTIPVTNRFEVDSWSGVQTRIAAGTALDDLIAGDLNGDGFVDVGREYDVTLGLRNLFSLAPGASDTYTTLTVFGSGAPNQLDFFAGGSVFDDLNGNGTKDPGEAGLANWTIFADQNFNGVLDSGSRTFQIPKVIADQETTVGAIQVANFNGLLTDVNVTLDLSHTNDSDLTVTLISPSGRRVQLFSGLGGTADNFLNTTFDDQTATSISTGAAPFSGTFRPMEALSGFNGENPNGIWQLEILDGTAGAQGTLNGWSMSLVSALSGTVIAESLETPQIIRDSRVVDSTIFVHGFTGDVTNIQVTLDITHAFDDDLDVVLISPGGVEVELFSDVGGSLNDFTNTKFADQIVDPVTGVVTVPPLISTGIAPFLTGAPPLLPPAYRPEGALSRFNSENPNGLWTLRVTDDRALDQGTLNNWSMTISTSENFTTSANNGDFNLRLPNAGTYFITEIPQVGWRQTTPGGSGSVPAVVTSNQAVTGLLFGNRVSNSGAPVVFLPGAVATYTENQSSFVDSCGAHVGGAILFDCQARVEDSNSASFNGGTMVVSLGATGTVNDRLEIGNQGINVGQISLSGTTIGFAGPQGIVPIGTYSGGNGTTPLSITLNGNASPSLTTALMRDITFRTVGDNPTTTARTVQLTLTDGVGGLTGTLSKTVNVVAVNDPPVNSLPAPVSVAKNFSVTIGAGNGGSISLSDLDALDADLVQVQLTALDGTLTLSTNNGLSFSFPADANGAGTGDGTADAIMVFRGSRTSVNTALNGLVFTPNPGFTGNTTIDILTNDLGTVGTGGALTDSDSLVATVVNLIPTLTAISTLTGASEDTDYVVTYAALSAAANAVDPNGDTISFRVDSVGTGSTLTKSTGFPVIPGVDVLSPNDFVIWRGPANRSGVFTGFSVRATDGTDVSSPAVAVNIDVAPLPDAPTLSLVSTLPGAFINTPAVNNVPFPITYAQLAAAANEGDVDGDLLSFRVESVDGGSTLEEGFGPVIPGNSQLSPGETWIWTSSLGASGATTAFTIVAIDPGGLTSGTPVAVMINVIPNQAPTLTIVGTLPGGLRNIAFPINYALLAGVADESDPDNDPISFRVESVTQGTLRKNGIDVVPGTTTLAAGESFSWLAPTGVQGTAVPAFTIVAFDGFRPSAIPIQVNVQLTNLPPTLTTIPTFTSGLEDNPFSISYATLIAQANEADLNNDPISFRIGQLGTGTLTINGQPVVAGTTFITTGDTVTWTPLANQSGVFPVFSVRAFDGDLLSNAEVPVNVVLTAVPDSPTLTSISTISQGFETLPFDFTFADVAAAANEADADGDAVNFRVESIAAGTLKKNGQTVVAGTTLLGPGETLVWTPPVGSNGVVTAFTVKATDGTRTKVLNVTNAGVLADGDRFTITLGGVTTGGVTTGGTSVTFEFENTTIGNGVTAGNVPVNFTAGQTAAQVAASIQAAIDGSSLDVVKPVPLSGSQVTIDGTVFNVTLSTAAFLNVANTTLLADGDRITIATVGQPITFEFENTALGNGVTAGNVPVNFTAGQTTATVAAALQTAINNSNLAVRKPAPLAGSQVTIDASVFNLMVTTTLVNAAALAVTRQMNAATMVATDGGLSPRALSATAVDVKLQVSSLQATELLRAYNRPLDYHFFTTSRSEFNNAVAHGYEPEAASATFARSGFAVTAVPAQGSLAIHRLRNPNSGRHYYTNNTAETNYLASIGWIYEKDEGFIFTAQLPNMVEVFKLYNRTTGAHVYVDSVATRDAILGLSSTWERHTSLGFAFHVNPNGAANLAPINAPARSAHSRGAASDEVLTRPLLMQLSGQTGATVNGFERNDLTGQMALRTGLVATVDSQSLRVDRRGSSGKPLESAYGNESMQSKRWQQLAFPSPSAVDDFWTNVGQMNNGLSDFLTE